MGVTHKVIWPGWWSWQMPSVRAERVRQEIQHSWWLASQKLVKMRNSIFLGVQVHSHLVTKAWQAGHFTPQLLVIHTTEPYRSLAPSSGLLHVVMGIFLTMSGITTEMPKSPTWKRNSRKVSLLLYFIDKATESNPSSGRNYRSGEVCHGNMSEAVFSLWVLWVSTRRKLKTEFYTLSHL